MAVQGVNGLPVGIAVWMLDDHDVAIEIRLRAKYRVNISSGVKDRSIPGGQDWRPGGILEVYAVMDGPTAAICRAERVITRPVRHVFVTDGTLEDKMFLHRQPGWLWCPGGCITAKRAGDIRADRRDGKTGCQRDRWAARVEI